MELLRLAARKLTGANRRAFVAEVTVRLSDGKVRQAEDRFGWNRLMIRKGLAERETGEVIPGHDEHTGRQRFEDLNAKFAADARDIAEPRTQTDPELKPERCNLCLTLRPWPNSVTVA